MLSSNPDLGKDLDDFDNEDRLVGKPEGHEDDEDDSENKLTPDTLVCHSSEFRCPNEEKCIAQSAVCDNIRDCWGGADEVHCEPISGNDHAAGDIDEMSGDRVPESECIEYLTSQLIHAASSYAISYAYKESDILHEYIDREVSSLL